MGRLKIEQKYLNNLYIEGRKSTELPAWILQKTTENDDKFSDDENGPSIEDAIDYFMKTKTE